jgi:hypothetical protein
MISQLARSASHGCNTFWEYIRILYSINYDIAGESGVSFQVWLLLGLSFWMSTTVILVKANLVEHSALLLQSSLTPKVLTLNSSHQSRQNPFLVSFWSCFTPWISTASVMYTSDHQICSNHSELLRKDFEICTSERAPFRMVPE